MKEPTVSVVMPVYNAEKYVEKAVESILLQTYSSFELIIVDDDSSDSSLRKINSFHDNRIKVLHNKRNKGIAYTTNLGIEMSEGKYIALMDDDDVSEPIRLEKQVMFLEKHLDIDIIGGAYEVINGEGEHISFPAVPRSNPKYIKAMLPFKCVDFANSTTMIRKQFMIDNNIWYRDGFYGMQDYQFFIEASNIGAISSIDERILKKREHSSCFTDLQINSNARKRAKKYAEMRKDALIERGFILDEKQLGVLNKVFPECTTQTVEKDDLENLYIVLKTIWEQARVMNVDYLKELELFLKKIFSERVYRSNLFEMKNETM